MQAKCAFVVPAAGIGSRFGSHVPKQYAQIHGKSVLEHTLNALHQALPDAPIVVAKSSQDHYFDRISLDYPVITCEGGSTRAHSVLNALKTLPHSVEWVLVHDGARCCVEVKDIENLVHQCTSQNQSGMLVAPSTDTLKQVKEGMVQTTIDRTLIYRALTPQMFKKDQLIEAIEQAMQRGLEMTDDASALEALGYPVMAIEGRATNIKITYPEDLAFAKNHLHQEETLC